MNKTQELRRQSIVEKIAQPSQFYVENKKKRIIKYSFVFISEIGYWNNMAELATNYTNLRQALFKYIFYLRSYDSYLVKLVEKKNVAELAAN